MRRILALFTFIVLVACSQNPAPLSNYGVSVGAGSSGMHTVSYGDTLSSISKRYHIKMAEIAYINQLSAPYKITVGQRLRVPPPLEYEVRSGDTLSTIARLFNVSQHRLVSLNDIGYPYRILTGQELKIPQLRGLEGEIVTAMAEPAIMQESSASIQPVKAEVLKQNHNMARPKFAAISKLPRSKPKRFLKPVSGKILSNFGPKKGGLRNDGINITAPRGTPVKSAATGQVVYAGNELKGFGNLVLIKHGGGYLTTYAHLGRIDVEKGMFVEAGQGVGIIGTSGQVKVPQLHFEIRKGTKAVDPKDFL